MEVTKKCVIEIKLRDNMKCIEIRCAKISLLATSEMTISPISSQRNFCLKIGLHIFSPLTQGFLPVYNML